jgi:hypothetical protein
VEEELLENRLAASDANAPTAAPTARALISLSFGFVLWIFESGDEDGESVEEDIVEC